MQIIDKARELGFELVGLTRAHPVPHYDSLLTWLDRGYAAMMGYLQRGAEKRGDPSKILPGVKTIICCGLNYFTENPEGPVSRYAWGDDYHSVVGDRLQKLEEFIRKIAPEAQTKSYVDTGPILERNFAAQAGLGWIGKNTCLINNGVGSYFFLGEILTTLEFEEHEYHRPVMDQCGTCTKCLEACPTQALVEAYVLDSNKCISYLTIEHRGDFSPEQKKMVGDHIYGCDICQQVCPYNERIQETPLKEFQPRSEWQEKQGEWKEWTEEEFKKAIRGSAMTRIKYPQWKRNLEN
ncbi:MAG: tRNA epoxyqueuosine(34) reductase QueG [Deltaproteobacteria bacterium]|nr:tRNA epoxyqueuosine(34) reductase QueG [Deltaproteobacteria bacterium]